ncbi:hypothetical protein HDV00_002544 [Rhizophlyctis rosea]|nr:hypothetical protein HDV00_002544 [Rhizophlyctis rosea]
MNGTLKTKANNSTTFAATFSFTVGTIPLLIYWLAETKGQKPSTEELATVPWWGFIGGALGCWFIASTAYLVTRLGGAMVFGTAVASQMAMAVILDAFALVGLIKRTATPERIIGLLINILGVLFISVDVDGWIRKRVKGRRSQRQDANGSNTAVDTQSSWGVDNNTKIEIEDVDAQPPPSPPTAQSTSLTTLPSTQTLLQPTPPPTKPTRKLPLDPTIIFAVIAGCCISIQAGVNGTLGRHTIPSFASFYSFASGTAILYVFLLADFRWGKAKGLNVRKALKATPWWAYLGGICGAIYVIIVVVITPQLGAAILLGASVCAQVITAVIMDHFALFNLPHKRARPGRLFGALLMICGVVLIILY